MQDWVEVTEVPLRHRYTDTTIDAYNTLQSHCSDVLATTFTRYADRLVRRPTRVRQSSTRSSSFGGSFVTLPTALGQAALHSRRGDRAR